MLHYRSTRSGYAMMIALVLIAVLTIIGATTLSVAGVDQRIATHNQRHMIITNAADAGTEHARWQLEHQNPVDEGWDSTDTGHYISATASGDGADAMFNGTAFPMNQGTYNVDAVYIKCSGPPPGYSTEQNHQSYRSDYWEMWSAGWFEDGSSGGQLNPLTSTVVATIRKVIQGPCKIR